MFFYNENIWFYIMFNGLCFSEGTIRVICLPEENLTRRWPCGCGYSRPYSWCQITQVGWHFVLLWESIESYFILIERWRPITIAHPKHFVHRWTVRAYQASTHDLWWIKPSIFTTLLFYIGWLLQNYTIHLF